MHWLLDTSVYSQFLRRKAVVVALERWKEAGDAACGISAATRAEVEWGLHFEDHPKRWKLYREELRDRLPCLPTDEAVWSRFSELKARQRANGEPVADLDLVIAATALRHDLVVATLNARDFSRIEGLRWEDWGGS